MALFGYFFSQKDGKSEIAPVSAVMSKLMASADLSGKICHPALFKLVSVINTAVMV